MTDDNTQPPAETLAATYEPSEAEVLAARLDESIAFKVYSSSDDDIRDAAAMLRRLSALTRRAGGDDAEREALAGYRAAVSFIAADSWDGCSDCVETLKAAWAADWQNDQAADPDETARQLARIRAHRPPVEPCAGGDAIPAGEVEPFGYWIEQRGADPMLLRNSVYIPEPSDLLTVTPLYTTQKSPSGGNAIGLLREAVRGVADDYQTSEAHHPHHVLIPVAKFEQLRAAAEALEASHD